MYINHRLLAGSVILISADFSDWLHFGPISILDEGINFTHSGVILHVQFHMIIQALPTGPTVGVIKDDFIWKFQNSEIEEEIEGKVITNQWRDIVVVYSSDACHDKNRPLYGFKKLQIFRSSNLCNTDFIWPSVLNLVSNNHKFDSHPFKNFTGWYVNMLDSTFTMTAQV